MLKFTNTEGIVMDLLKDGKRHTTKDVRDHVDRFMSPAALCHHICHIRAKIKPIGQDIVCEYRNRRTHYRLVRLLNPDA